MRGVYFLSRERLVHADSDERGETIKKKKVEDRETCNEKLSGSPGGRVLGAGARLAPLPWVAGAAGRGCRRAWLCTDLDPVCRIVLQVT